METEQAVTKPAAKARPRQKRRAKPAAAPKAEGLYAGLTVANCASGCTAKACVISGIGICAHPAKGGLQALMQAPDTIRRFNEAKRVIGKRKFEVTDES